VARDGNLENAIKMQPFGTTIKECCIFQERRGILDKKKIEKKFVQERKSKKRGNSSV